MCVRYNVCVCAALAPLRRVNTYNANGYTNERLETRTRYDADGYTNASHSAGTGVCVGASGCSSTDAGQRYLRRRVIEIVA